MNDFNFSRYYYILPVHYIYILKVGIQKPTENFSTRCGWALRIAPPHETRSTNTWWNRRSNSRFASSKASGCENSNCTQLFCTRVFGFGRFTPTAFLLLPLEPHSCDIIRTTTKTRGFTISNGQRHNGSSPVLGFIHVSSTRVW